MESVTITGNPRKSDDQMATRPLSLAQWLGNQNLPSDLNLPWAHSTSANNLFDIIESGKLLATPCNVFKGERLCYLFIGRPAYKTKPVENPSPWQLPVAFVVRFPKPPPIKRIFPFDSGAFFHKKLPSYITMFKMAGYDIASDPTLVGRLVSFYFKTPERYFKRRPAGLEELKEDHNLDMRHAEVMALGRLYQENSAPKFDDRAAAIEVQVEEDIELKPENLIGIVMPSEYARTPGFMIDIKKLTSIVETYDLFPLGSAAHYGLLYEGVQRVYKRAGIKP
jgi:hypothetical protein